MKKNESVSGFIKSHALLVILILGLIIRLMFFISLQPWDDYSVSKYILHSDSPGYNNLGLSLAATKSFDAFDGFRTPGYPVFLSLIYLFKANCIWLVLIVQIILSVISAYWVYRLALFYFSQKVALLASFLFLIDYIQIVSSVQVLTETLYVFLFLWSVFLTAGFLKNKKILLLVFGSALLAAATLVRPVSYYMPVILALALFFSVKAGIKQKLLYVLLYCFVFAASLSPWIMRNQAKYGSAELTSVKGFNMLFYNVATVQAYKNNQSIEEVRADLYNKALPKLPDSDGKMMTAEDMKINFMNSEDGKGFNPPSTLISMKNSKVFMDMSSEYIKENKGLYIKRSLSGILFMYCASPAGGVIQNFHIKSQYADYVSSNRFSANFSYADLFRLMSPLELLIIFVGFFYMFINYVFAFGDFVSKIKKKENLQFIILAAAIVIYFTALTGIVGASRYRMPFMPFFNIMCASGIYGFIEWIKTKRARLAK